MSYQQAVSVSSSATYVPPSLLSERPSRKSTNYIPLRQSLRDSYPLNREGVLYDSPYELLIAAILLPQATVQQVNSIMPALFAAYPTPIAMATAKRRDIEQYIRNIGFYRQKTKYLQLTSQMLLSEYDGAVPRTLMGLTRLPGVARKSANLIMAELYGKVEGVMVDTRVKRVAVRLGLADGKSAEAIENDLMRVMPREDWLEIPQLMTAHADAVCGVRAPKCNGCPLSALCPSAVINS